MKNKTANQITWTNLKPRHGLPKHHRTGLKNLGFLLKQLMDVISFRLQRAWKPFRSTKQKVHQTNKACWRSTCIHLIQKGSNTKNKKKKNNNRWYLNILHLHGNVTSCLHKLFTLTSSGRFLRTLANGLIYLSIRENKWINQLMSTRHLAVHLKEKRTGMNAGATTDAERILFFVHQ